MLGGGGAASEDELAAHGRAAGAQGGGVEKGQRQTPPRRLRHARLCHPLVDFVRL